MKKEINYVEVVCKTINTFRQNGFDLNDFVKESGIPKVKSMFIIRKLKKYGIIYFVENRYKVCNPALPVYIKQFTIPVQSALDSYYNAIGSDKKLSELQESDSIKSNESISIKSAPVTSVPIRSNSSKSDSELTEELCIEFLKATGKYQIYKKSVEWNLI